jgi:hypothetical protein
MKITAGRERIILGFWTVRDSRKRAAPTAMPTIPMPLYTDPAFGPLVA